VKAAELYVDLLKNGAPPGAAGFNLDDANNVFGQDKAWSMISYNFMLTWLNDPAQSKVVNKARMTTMPGGTGLLGGWGWAIPKSSAHPDAAWEFIRWVESPEIALARGMAGGMPTRLDVYNNADFQAKYPFQKDILEIIKTDKPVPQMSRSPQMTEAISVNMSDAVAGQKTPKQAMDDANKLLADLLK
jgi:multiple sugar transport system substrate-binding protein